jgi:hypothetical protein
MLSDHQFSDSKDFKYPAGYRKSYPNQGNRGAARHPADIMRDGNPNYPETLMDSARGGGVDGQGYAEVGQLPNTLSRGGEVDVDGYDNQFPNALPHVYEPFKDPQDPNSGNYRKSSGPSMAFDNMMGNPMEALDQFPTSYTEDGGEAGGEGGGDGG